MNHSLFKRLFINRDFFFLYTSSIVNSLGNKLSIAAMPLLAIYLFNTDVMETTMVTALSFLPNLLFSSHIGVIVDRHNKRNILIISNLLCFIVSLLAFILAYYQQFTLHLFYVYILINNTLLLFGGVSFSSEMPIILKKEELKEGNYRLEISNGFVQTIGPTLAGFLLEILFRPFIFLVDGVTFLISAILRSFIESKEKPSAIKNQVNESYFLHIKKSYQFVFSHAILSKMAISYFIVVFSIGIFQSLQIFYLKSELGFSALKIGYIFSVGNIGLVLSSVFCKKISNVIGHGKTMILALSLYGFSFLLYATGGSGNIVPIIISHLLLGVAIPLYNVNMSTLRQQTVDIKMLASVSVIWRILGRGLIPFGAVLAGLFSEKFSIHTTLLLACAIAFIGIIPILLSKDVREHVLE